jgi:hypothetical protein
MDHKAFEAALEKMGYSPVKFARLIDQKSPTTVRNWIDGSVKLPGPVATVVAFMLEQPIWRAWFEQRRPDPEKPQRKRGKRIRGMRK